MRGKTGQNCPRFIRGYPVGRALEGKYVNWVITLQHARLAMGGSQMGSPSSIMTSHLPPTQNPHPKPTISPEQPTNKCCATWHNPGCFCNSGGPAGIGRGVFPCYTASHNLKRSSFFRFFIFFRLRCAECLFRTDYLLLGK